MRFSSLKIFILFFCLSFGALSAADRQAKYVFYFITDGTGVNTVLGAEMYRAELQGRIGREPFCMTSFPVVGVSSTYSHSHGVTDSAASGTALATGKKTKNRALGLLPDLQTPCTSIAVWAKEAGCRVGVATSVGVTHATPAAFYAHVADRGQYYQVGLDMLHAGFDFYGGSDFNVPVDTKNFPDGVDLYSVARSAGYTVARSYDAYKTGAATASKMILLQSEAASAVNRQSIPYAIDAKPGDLTIEDIFRAELDFMMKDSTRGFFLMNEIGGKVDFACHANDAAAAFAEVAAVDRCVRLAYDFYLRHPDETLIVLTADHETGGLVLGSNKTGSTLNLKILAHQKLSQDGFTALLHELRRQTGNKVTWEQVKTALADNFGFWGAVSLTDDEEKQIAELYEKSFCRQMAEEKNLYTSNEPMAGLANRIMAQKAGLSWTVGGHSAGLVPVYACGVGAERFMGHNDNAKIPLVIAEIAGYAIPQ